MCSVQDEIGYNFIRDETPTYDEVDEANAFLSPWFVTPCDLFVGLCERQCFSTYSPIKPFTVQLREGIIAVKESIDQPTL